MAEWGKGDPRWVVEQRADGKNVNAWHWEEKDCSVWTKQYAEEKFPEQLKASSADGDMQWTFTSFSSFDGEINWYNRKGKLFTLYDYNITMKFSGVYQGKELTGKLEVSDFEQDCEEESEWRVKLDKESTLKPLNLIPYKRWIRDVAKKAFIAAWAALIVDLHESQKVTNSSLAAQAEGKLRTSLPKLADLGSVKETPPPVVSAPGTGVHEETLVFSASPEDLFSLFTVEGKASYFTMAAAKIDPKEGGFFSLYDGTISGTFLDLVPSSKLRFTWRIKDWPSDVNSTVDIALSSANGGTQLHLRQTGIPNSDLERTRGGWDRFYWSRMKGVFGFSYTKK